MGSYNTSRWALLSEQRDGDFKVGPCCSVCLCFVPFYSQKYSYHILFIQLLIDGTLGGFLFLDIMSNTAVNIDVRVFVRAYVFISLGYIPGVQLLCPVTLCFNILRSCQSLFQASTQSYIPTSAFGFFFWHVYFLNQIYYFFYGSEVWILERPFSPKTIKILLYFLLVFLWFYIAILGLCGVHPVYSLNMEPTFFSFLICLPIGLNTHYWKFHLFLSALRVHL